MRRWIALTLFGCILLRLNSVVRHLQQADDLPGSLLSHSPKALSICSRRGSFFVTVRLRIFLAVVLVFAALLRLTILFASPYLSDDIYRYVWDGRVQAAGINPYRFVPADPSVTHSRKTLK